MNVDTFDHQSAEVLAWWNLDFQFVRLFAERLLRHLFVSLDTRLAFRLASLGAHADPFQFTRQHPIACLLLALLDRHPFRLGFQPSRVIPFERDAATAVDFQNPLRHVVQEVTIVRYRHDGSGVIVQVLFKPRDAFGIQVVGRFVQQQQIGLADQQLAKCDPAFLATGKVGHGPIARRQVHHRHRNFDLPIEFPQIVGVDRVLQFGHLVAQLLHLGVVGDVTQQPRDFVVAIDNRTSFGHSDLDVLLHSQVLVEVRFLR